MSKGRELAPINVSMHDGIQSCAGATYADGLPGLASWRLNITP